MMARPACMGTDPEMWFSPHPLDVADCLKVCAGCPVRKACLAGAVRRRELYGIWGGRLFSREPSYPRALLRAARVAA